MNFLVQNFAKVVSAIYKYPTKFFFFFFFFEVSFKKNGEKNTDRENRVKPHTPHTPCA